MQALEDNIDYQWVRAAFILKGTSFSRWCNENNVSRAWAISALNCKATGNAASDLRAKIIEAARVSHD